MEKNKGCKLPQTKWTARMDEGCEEMIRLPKRSSWKRPSYAGGSDCWDKKTQGTATNRFSERRRNGIEIIIDRRGPRWWYGIPSKRIWVNQGEQEEDETEDEDQEFIREETYDSLELWLLNIGFYPRQQTQHRNYRCCERLSSITNRKEKMFHGKMIETSCVQILGHVKLPICRILLRVWPHGIKVPIFS